MQELPDNIMQELPDVPQHGTGPEISSSPATHHDVGSTTDIPEVISPGAGSEDPGQGLFARNHPFSDNISTSDLSKDPSNLNKVSPTKGQQQGSKSSAQANTSTATSEQLEVHERLHSAIDLASNTREVGTQTGESSQNETNFLELVKTQVEKGFKRLTQPTRLDESCINLVNQKQVETKELQLSQNSPNLSRTTSNAFEVEPLCKSLEKIPSGLKIQEGFTLNITGSPGSLRFTPDVLLKILNNEQDVLPEERVQVVTNKRLINTNKQLMENKPAAKLKTGLIDVYIAPQSEENNPVESGGVAVINDEGVPLSPNLRRTLLACQESLRSPENIAVLQSVETKTGKAKDDLIKAVYNNISKTITKAAALAIDGNGQGEVGISFGVSREFTNTKFEILSTASLNISTIAYPSMIRYNKLAFSSVPFQKGNDFGNQANQQRQGANQQGRRTPLSTRAFIGARQTRHHQGPMHKFSLAFPPPPSKLLLGSELLLGSASSATQTGLTEASAYKRHQSQSQAEFDKNISERDEDQKKNDTSTVKNICERVNNLDPNLCEELKQHSYSYSTYVEKKSKELFSFSIKGETSNRYDFKKQDSSQKKALKKAKEEGQISLYLLDWLFTSEVGLTTENKIFRFLNRTHKIPSPLVIYVDSPTSQGGDNLPMTGLSLKQKVPKQVTVSRGFPSMVMCFASFKEWNSIRNCLKIPDNRKKFKTDLAAAEEKFFTAHGKNVTTESLVFEFKRAIARLEIFDVHIDHLFMEYQRGGMASISTGRVRREADIDPSGASIIPAQPNNIRSFLSNSFIENLNVKLYGIVPFLYALYSYSITDDFFLVSLELQLAPWRYKDDKKKNIIKNTAKLLGINESVIDLSPEEITNGLNNMLNGAVYEAYRLYEQNHAKFDLPRQVQVALFENTIHLQNVGYVLQSSKDIFADKTKLTVAFEKVMQLTNDLKALCDVIDEVNKTTNPNYTQLSLQSASSAIEENLKSFVIEPLQKMRIVSSSSDSSVESQINSYSKQLEVKRTLITMTESKLCSTAFQQLLESYKNGTIMYEKFLNNASYAFYRAITDYELYRVGKKSLFGTEKKA